jgi:hypothetical protein
MLGGLAYWTGFHLMQLSSPLPAALFGLVVVATVVPAVRDIARRRLSLPTRILIGMWAVCVLVATFKLAF